MVLHAQVAAMSEGVKAPIVVVAVIPTDIWMFMWISVKVIHAALNS